MYILGKREQSIKVNFNMSYFTFFSGPHTKHTAFLSVFTEVCEEIDLTNT